MFESVKKIFGKSESQENTVKEDTKQPITFDKFKLDDCHPMIKRVAFLMQQKLNMRIDRYPKAPDGNDHWVACKSIRHLITHFNAEIGEFNAEYVKLSKNIKEGREVDNLKELVYEAADVCNLMGMFLDKLNFVLSKEDPEFSKKEFEKSPDWKPEDEQKV